MVNKYSAGFWCTDRLFINLFFNDVNLHIFAMYQNKRIYMYDAFPA